jgi:hypothetical protein
MTPIPIQFPSDASVTGEILSSYSHAPLRRTEDILQVRLGSGKIIDVGWYPAWDPLGAFQVVIYEGYWDNQLIQPIVSVDPYEIAGVVQDLARQYSQTVGAMNFVVSQGSLNERRAVGVSDASSSTMSYRRLVFSPPGSPYSASSTGGGVPIASVA